MNTLGAHHIPIAKTHLFDWWQPVRPGRPWFYWTRRETPYFGPVDPGTVDPHVLPVVQWANAMGYPTTPSCEGHFVDPLANTDWGRKSDAKLLRKGGLVLRNTETGEEINPLVRDWKEPDPALTHQQLVSSNGQGAIGIVFSKPFNDSWLRVHKFIEPVWIENMLLIQTFARKPEDVPVLWAHVIQTLRTFGT